MSDYEEALLYLRDKYIQAITPRIKNTKIEPYFMDFAQASDLAELKYSSMMLMNKLGTLNNKYTNTVYSFSRAASLFYDPTDLELKFQLFAEQIAPLLPEDPQLQLLASGLTYKESKTVLKVI